MNKTVTMNLSGLVFHIDENAYQNLSAYLNKLKLHFNKEEGSDEIISDIETRIAELFKERTNTGKEVITIKDVDEVIEIMGKPEEYDDNNESSQDNDTNGSSNYSTTNNKKGKRLYRDPDGKVLGGVCGGIAAYFGIDPVIPRIIFAILFFGWGTGFLFYVLLWLIVPEASTTAEKLEMKGEPVNISNIEKSIKDEVDELKKKLNDLSNDGKTREYKEKGKSFIQNFINLIASLLNGIFKAIGKILTTIIIIAALTLLIIFLTGLFGKFWGNIDYDFNSLSYMFSTLFTNQWYGYLFISGIILVIGIPLVAIMVWAIKKLFGIKASQKKHYGSIMGYWWVAGFIFLIVSGILFTRNFSNKVLEKEEYHLSNFSKIYIKPSLAQTIINNQEPQEQIIIDGECEYRPGKANISFGSHVDGWMLLKYADKQILQGPIKFKIVESDDKNIHLDIYKYSRGKNKKEAELLSKSINYDLLIKDSLILLPDYLEMKVNDDWRDQQVKVILKLPEGVKVEFLNMPENYKIWGENLTNNNWEMTTDGFTCIDCKEDVKIHNQANFLKNEQLDISNFNTIEFDGNFKVNIEQDNEYHVAIEGSEETVELIEIENQRGILKIGIEDFSVFDLLQHNEPVEINIKAPDIQKLVFEGAITCDISGFEENNLSIESSGASNIEIENIVVHNLAIDLSGASTIKIEGSGDILNVELSGAGKIDAEEYEVKEANIELSGAGKARIYCSQQLDVKISGAGSVYYKGKPENINRTIMGIGKLKQID